MENLIDKLLTYAQKHLDFDDANLYYSRNLLIEALRYPEYRPSSEDYAYLESYTVPDKLYEEVKLYLITQGIVPSEEVEIYTDYIFGLLTPMPAQVNQKFQSLVSIDPRKATDYLYDLSIKNNYIKKSFVDKNVHWKAYFPNNSLDITINVSKPEKSNAEIALAKGRIDTGYPLCVLCHENEGFYGRPRKENRTTLRSINLNLNAEKWFFQYSPFVYYDRHCIVIDEVHRPMKIEKRSLGALLDFVDQFPHFFIGSNSDLPIVGGSILNHEHFQGGAYILPIMDANPIRVYPSSAYPNTSISTLDWYNTTLLIESIDKNELLSSTLQIIEKWREYFNAEVDILAYDENNIPHNSATILLRKVKDVYKLYLILRNNRTTSEYPDGIFHAHKEYHHLKKEGIGLIEAGGMFILPGRLVRQIDKLKQVIFTSSTLLEAINYDEETRLFARMIEHTYHSKDRNLDNAMRDYINKSCRDILENTAVFKKTEVGQKAFFDFISQFIKI